MIRLALTETLLLAAIGGAAGLLLAYVGTRGILLLAFRGSTYVPITASPSLPVLGFAFLLSAITGLIFGVAPAWINTHAEPSASLRGSGRSTASHSSKPKKALVVLQAALSLVLLAVAGLFTESLRNMEKADLGFETQDRLIANLNFKAAGYQPGQLPALYQQLQGRLERLPGVRSASLSLNSPQNLCCINLNISIGGRSDAWIEKVNVVFLRVSPHYFETIGTPLLRGRGVTERDMPSSQHVAIVDSAFAQKFFPGEDPIGKHFGLSLPGHGSDYQIVGVAKDTKYRSPGSEQSPMFFLPFTQTTQYEPDGYRRLETATLCAQSIQLHVAGAPERYEDSFRQTLASTNPNLSLIKVKTYREQVAVQFNRERLIARLTALFGIFALLLASVGLYGVTAYNVEGRTREIGVRIALGANRGKVLSMVLYGALWQVCGGLCMGIPLAMLCGRYLAHELYGLGKLRSARAGRSDCCSERMRDACGSLPRMAGGFGRTDPSPAS